MVYRLKVEQIAESRRAAALEETREIVKARLADFSWLEEFSIGLRFEL